MTHYADLTPCDYFGEAHTLIAVGWLAGDEPFPTGPTESAVFTKLKELLEDAWQPVVFRGVHDCELCQYDPPWGHANLFVPSGSAIFVCPGLILHYIAAHHYRPPEEFVTAVMNCPHSRTMEYKKLVLASGGRSLAANLR